MKTKILQISGATVCSMFKRKTIHEIGVMPNGLPDDARVVGARLNNEMNFIELIIESDEYDEVPEGESPPTMDPPTFITCSFSRTLSEIADGMVRGQDGNMIVLQHGDIRKMASIAVGSVLKAIGILH